MDREEKDTKEKHAEKDRTSAEMLWRFWQEIIIETDNQGWRNEKLPRDWYITLIVEIYRKEDPKEFESNKCSNEHRMNTRIKKKLEEKLAEVQNGFRKDRSME
ncbi:hypothetical protein HHI36_017303 [Cryptolaemus montrouzieri]|uniref:Uncharacterized protein n=1 Tax=Cryptolaemus montrouzieri TaxID=559131 RepID=A0ABD2NMI0_9CUCU